MTRLIRVFSAIRARAPLLILVVVILVAFIAGFAAALFIRTKPQAQAVSVPPTDFGVVLPEGSTTITITDPRFDPSELARVVVQRHGNTIVGLPESRKQVSPRKGLSPADLEFFRNELAGVFSPSDSAWQRAIRIRNWLVTTDYRTAMPGLSTRVPREAYLQMRQGRPVLCGNLAEIYVALCQAAGIVARPVGLSLMVREGTFGSDTHAGAEVWMPEMGGWIYQDSTFDCQWEIDGKPASALQLHNALMEGREIKLSSQNPLAETLVRSYYIDPRLFFRHISYEYKAGGPLVYYVDGRLEPLNMHDRFWLQTDDPAVIESLDTTGNTIVERRGELAPGIFAQMIGNVLFIRDRRDQNRGIRVRSSTGPVEVCAYEHWRAEELGIFSGNNLVTNGSFNLTEKSEPIAVGWSVSGPVEALTTMGGQGMGAQPGGKLWQRILVRPGGRYLMYAKISVSRGIVMWSVSDSSRGMDSRGVIKPSQLAEVVSDVIESHSGYLDVSFELPEGGGFRVMDVIVTEMPTNAVEKLSQNLDHDKNKLAR
ncbi:MAG: transglutaminase-like domain-containing protein [Acidobacteriota bacterium]